MTGYQSMLKEKEIKEEQNEFGIESNKESNKERIINSELFIHLYPVLILKYQYKAPKTAPPI